MGVSDQVQRKLMGPLKNSFIAAILSVTPGMLTQASQDALSKIEKTIAEEIGKDVEEELNAEDMFDVQDFGPDTSSDVAPQNQNTETNFTPEGKDDIIDQNPQKSPPTNTSNPQADTDAPAENKPFNQFDDDQETSDHNASQGNLGGEDDESTDENAGESDDGADEGQSDQGQQQKMLKQMEALEQAKQKQIAPERQKLAPLEKEKNSLENKKLALTAQQGGLMGILFIVYIISGLLIIISLPLMIFGIGFGIFGAAIWLTTWGRRVYKFKMAQISAQKEALSKLIDGVKKTMKPLEANIKKVEKESNAQIRAIMSQYRTSK